MMFDALTLDQLRILITVSETGSFSAAGRKLSRAQSAISQSIQTLEVTQGIRLFDRSGRSPKLTDAGRVLVGQAHQVLHQADMFQGIATAIAGGTEAELTLAVDSFLPTAPIVDSLRALSKAFPDLPVTLFTEGLGASVRRLRSRTAALGICALFPQVAPDLHAIPLMSITLVPVVASSHPLATAARPITREMLQDHVQLVLTDPYDSSGPSYTVISAQVWRFADLGRRLEFLIAGFGWANMPAHLVAPHVANGQLTELDISDSTVTANPLPIFAVHERTRPLRKAARWLLLDIQQRLSTPEMPAAAQARA